MTAQRLEPGRRPSRWVGCVVRVEVGVLVVLTDAGEVRASLDGSLLARVARDRSALPVPGDWVPLRRWADGRVTALTAIRPDTALAPVLALRP